MQCWQIAGAFGIDRLVQTKIEHRPLKNYEARIKVYAASLNYRDLMVVKGQYNPRQFLPLIPVSDGAGMVVEVGSDVKSLAVGDRVCATLAQEWEHGAPDKAATKSTLGCPHDGMLTEEAIFHEKGLIKFPDFLSYEEASTLPCAALTAFNALVYESSLLPGDTILIQGTGGVSLFALLFAKIFNLNSIVLSSSDDKLLKAKDIGATHSINYLKTPDWPKEVLDITNGIGVNSVIEVVGGANINKSVAAVKKSGAICLIGVLGGASEPINLVPILMNNIKIHGVFVGNKAMFSSMNRVIEHGKIRPPIDKIFNFKEAPQAFNYLASAKHFGKIVIKITS